MTADTVRELALDTARLLDEQKAEDVIIYAVAELTVIADYFVISTGRNTRHLKALAREVCECLEKIGKKPRGREGEPDSGWMIIDAGDVVVHIFDKKRRSLYNLEMLWGDAESVDFGAA